MSQAAVSAQSAPLNVLIVEDSEEDADLIVLELKRGGFEPVFRRVESADQMKHALEERTWDVILSDFSMPRFSLPDALHLVQQKGVDVPFVIVSATIGEEAAVEAMRAGAHDYVLKHRLARLVPAVQRELREAAVRRERRNLEEQLQHAQKLESLGLLAGGVAHDFNNLLTGILGNASLVVDILKPEPVVRGMLEEIIRAGERAADLTRQLLAYAGKGRFLIESVDVSALVLDISELIRTSVPRTIDLALDLPSQLPAIEADPSQVQQLVMNLILNAVEATGERPGCVRVATGLHYVRPGDPVGHYRPDPPVPGHYVRIEVRDNGCGMSESIKQQIFDPFFTTKFLGRGLGLAAALGIVRGHKGAIGVESLENVGSTFTVLLPAMGGTASGRLGARHTLQSPEPSAGVILVIDDEDVVRHAARAALEHAGFTIFEACDGQDGADLFSRLHDRVSAVLVDLTMPRMDGRGVWEYIRRLRPDMRVVVSSGFDESEAMRQFGDDSELAFIHKPYTAAALIEKMRNALER
ncbi:MAG TPA: response regulator [Bryobacteraceae bacterium]|nr:response regulator [Bryobacteraceae bacterium]